jgi:uncharacterized OsmC-like protein
MAENGVFSLDLERVHDYEFKTTFDDARLGEMIVDEPEPLGHGKGPNPARLLGVAVGDCLSASLLFCLQKAKIAVNSVKTNVTGYMQRNEKGRLRIGKLDVHMVIDLGGDQRPRIGRCLELFEDFCVVTASVKKGIPISVVVMDSHGNELFRDDGNSLEH